MFRGFLILISFFTRLPIGSLVEYDEKYFIKGLRLYSLVGLVIGLFLSIGYFLGSFLEIIYIKGLIITVFYIIITGGIHLDGASDTTDGLFSGRSKEKIFEIMSDPRVGSFGVISLILILFSQIILFANVDLSTIILMPMVGKFACVVACFKSKYAKENKGMGTLFIESIKIKELIFNIIEVLIICIVLKNDIINIMSTILTIFISIFIKKSIIKKISGMTGDTCGFITEISQIIFMFIYLFMGKAILI